MRSDKAVGTLRCHRSSHIDTGLTIHHSGGGSIARGLGSSVNMTVVTDSTASGVDVIGQECKR